MRSNQTLSSFHKLVRKEFSLFYRQKAADWRGYVRCYTCGVLLRWQAADLGHFRHINALDFEPKANRVQCAKCNRYLSGNLGVFAVKLIKEIGLKEVEKLNKAHTRVFTLTELRKIRLWIERMRRLELKEIKR